MAPSAPLARWFTFGRWMRGGITARAIQILLLSYLLGFALPVANAITVLHQPAAAGPPRSSGNQVPSTALAGYLTVLVLALLAAVLGMRTARLSPLDLDANELGLRAVAHNRRQRSAAVVMYVGLLGITIGASVNILNLCGIHGTGASSGIAPRPGALPVEVFHAAIAGVVEEPVLLALPMALGWRTRWPWPVTLAVMIALRISFHVYYGWVSLFVMPWIAATVVLYRWCPVLWPFVLGHGLFDLLVTLQVYGTANTQRAASAIFDIAVGAGAALGTYVLLSRVREQVRARDGRLGGPRSRSRTGRRRSRVSPKSVTVDDWVTGTCG